MAFKKDLNKDLQAGFTLIEVLISLTLLVLISFSIYTTSRQTLKLREKIITEGDFYNGIRLAVGLIDQDIAALFSPVHYRPLPVTSQATSTNRNANAAPKIDPRLQDIQRSPLGQLSDYWLPATDGTGIRPSRFYGKGDELRFVLSNHDRMYRDSPESIFAKVSYQLVTEPDKDYKNPLKALKRIVDPNAFDDREKPTEFEKKSTILHGIKSFKLRYFNKAQNQWRDDWDNGQAELLEQYPDLVELKIKIEHPNGRLTFDGVYFFKIETPFHAISKTF